MPISCKGEDAGPFLFNFFVFDALVSLNAAPANALVFLPLLLAPDVFEFLIGPFLDFLTFFLVFLTQETKEYTISFSIFVDLESEPSWSTQYCPPSFSISAAKALFNSATSPLE